ncbi:MAG: alpha/beta hydrolase [Syntrophothermus sp.]|uniref:alpha/beta hydrolase n=1 Tax=Syntrophothermus sp. TaxID=2736299 RepID=UPI00257E62E5|nr:alpha/beta hydrolase [Syntrophothermus sp.]NSW83823.1 alpha/beta hydrolase [Syntrophothermus sp.]
MPDYSVIDHPDILQYLFFPRKDNAPGPPHSFDVSVNVDPDVFVSCRFYVESRDLPWILYFHGNGEVVSDHDDISLFYNRIGLNLVVADYRGYGASTGSPTFSNLVKDAHAIWDEVRATFSRRGYSGGLWVMGRSMGSVSALELASSYPDLITGFIIESGFASPTRLIRHLGLPAHNIDLNKLETECLSMIRDIRLPALIIHGQLDTLVPLSEAKLLFEQLGSLQKKIEVIPYADHNNIIYVGLQSYFKAIYDFVFTSPK